MELKGIEHFKKGTELRRVNEEPTLLSFFMLFNTKSHLLDPEGATIQYLRETVGGDLGNQYADRLIHFQKLLLRINREMPWFWQELGGLETVLKFEKMADPYWGDDKMIEITCLEENIELMGNSLMFLYRAACFDLNRWVEVIPKKLREFSVDIFVTEVRSFQQNITDREKNLFGEFQRNSDLKDTGKSLAPSMSTDAKPYIHVSLGHCQWDMESGKEILEGLTKNPEMKRSKLRFSYSSVRFPSYRGGAHLGRFEIDDTSIPEPTGRVIPDAYDPNASVDGSEVQETPKLGSAFEKTAVGENSVAESAKKEREANIAGKLAAAVAQKAGNKMSELKNRATGAVNQVKNAIDSFTGLGGTLGNAHGNILGGFAGQLLNNAVDKISGDLFLDNVYGINAFSTINEAITQGSINGLLNPGGSGNSGKPGSGQKLSEDNVYDAFAPDSDYLSKDNVHGKIAPDKDGPLNSNVHE